MRPHPEGIDMKRFMYEAVIGEDETGFYAYVPDLEGCFGGGDTFAEAIESITDGLETHIESFVEYGMDVPPATFGHAPEADGESVVVVSFYADCDVMDGYVTASEAARTLGVTKARVSHLIRDGKLDAYRKDRSTFVTRKSLNERVAALTN